MNRARAMKRATSPAPGLAWPALTLACILGCGEGRRSDPGSETVPALDQPVQDDPAAVYEEEDEPSPPQAPATADIPADTTGIQLLSGSLEDEREALRRVGATRAWNAVVERGNYLARRRRRGAVHGRVGPSAGAYRWLIDESEGSGSLALRLAVPPDLELAVDQRVVAFGAWHVDAERQWYWQADELAALPARDWNVPEPARSVPGHVIVDIPEAPAGALPVSEITPAGGIIVFEVVRAAADPADGWEISDQSRWRASARLYLPGERESYGGQDLRSASEHWQLERNTRYTVRIKRFVPAKPGEMPNLSALDAPRRIVANAARKPRALPR